MIKRVIDISEPSYLYVEHNQLCVDRNKETIARISVEDLGVLILDHPAIVVTQAAIKVCQQNNAVVLFCDERHLPISITLPLWEGHSLHTKVLREQLSITIPARKRLWQQVVKEKITQQIATLDRAGCSAEGLRRLLKKVKSGDTDNCEAQAARQYWPLLMGKSFRRNPADSGANSLLNYGYSIVRAMVARAIVGTGLHPAIGLHHKNQYNGLCLADDVMEPFRPWVDWKVFELQRVAIEPEITKDTKQVFLAMLGQGVLFEKRKMPLMVAVHFMAARLKEAHTDKTTTLLYPKRFEF
ncbi:MAG: type II CRISPR-associated endonuclease Cas1 [Pseudomonadales bacterium]|nr:type II CRISPR-associated endonuclease Cas1 [Pseudomonadales bacterium]